jgi:hypothetical protein
MEERKKLIMEEEWEQGTLTKPDIHLSPPSGASVALYVSPGGTEYTSRGSPPNRETALVPSTFVIMRTEYQG